MLTLLEFKQPQKRIGGCNQFRVTTNPLDLSADGRTVYIQLASNLTSGDRLVPCGGIADQSASTCDLKTFCRTEY